MDNYKKSQRRLTLLLFGASLDIDLIKKETNMLFAYDYCSLCSGDCKTNGQVCRCCRGYGVGDPRPLPNIKLFRIKKKRDQKKSLTHNGVVFEILPYKK